MHVQFTSSFIEVREKCQKEVEAYIKNETLYKNIGFKLDLGLIKWEHKSGLQKANEFLCNLKTIIDKKGFVSLITQPQYQIPGEFRNILIECVFKLYGVTQKTIDKLSEEYVGTEQFAKNIAKEAILERIFKNPQVEFNEVEDEKLEVAYHAGL